MLESLPIKKISIIKSIIFIVMMIAALSFEQAALERLLILILFSCVYLIIIGVKYTFYNNNNKWLFLIAFFEILTVLALENESRYMINYFIHIIYILALIENAYMFGLKRNIILQVSIIFISNIKYIILLSTMPTFAYITQFGFFLFINILIAISIDITIVVNQSRNETKLLNQELMIYQDKLSEMVTAEERNRIARELHDNLGHELSALIMELEITKHLIDKNLDESKTRLNSSLDNARNTLTTVRNIVEALDEEDSYNLLQLIENFSKQTNINISYEGIDMSVLSTKINEVIYKTVKEALTNAVKHSQATQIAINIIKENSDNVGFTIWNNGCQPSTLREGFGLTNMRRRIQQIGGHISFEINDCFTVKGQVRSKI